MPPLPPRPASLLRDLRFNAPTRRTSCFRTLPYDVAAVVPCSTFGVRSCAARLGHRARSCFDGSSARLHSSSHAAGTAQWERPTPHAAQPAGGSQLHRIFAASCRRSRPASRTLWDFPDAVEIQMTCRARVCDERAPTWADLRKLCDHFGGELGEFPETPSSTDSASISGAGASRASPLPSRSCVRRVSLADEYGQASRRRIPETGVRRLARR